jgi:hypothetical protein
MCPFKTPPSSSVSALPSEKQGVVYFQEDIITGMSEEKQEGESEEKQEDGDETITQLNASNAETAGKGGDTTVTPSTPMSLKRPLEIVLEFGSHSSDAESAQSKNSNESILEKKHHKLARTGIHRSTSSTSSTSGHSSSCSSVTAPRKRTNTNQNLYEEEFPARDAGPATDCTLYNSTIVETGSVSITKKQADCMIT